MCVPSLPAGLQEVLAFIEAHVVTQKDAVFGNRAGAFLKVRMPLWAREGRGKFDF